MRSVVPSVHRWTMCLCVAHVLAAFTHAIILMLDTRYSRSRVVLAVFVACIYVAMTCLACSVKRYGEKRALCIFCVFLLTEPLLDNHRSSWVLSVSPVELPDDATFVLQLLATAMSSQLLVPMRIRIAWIVSALPPLLYIFFTLPLAHHDAKSDMAHSLMVTLLLCFLCSIIIITVVHLEAALREKFISQYGKQQSTAKSLKDIQNEGIVTSLESHDVEVDKGTASNRVQSDIRYDSSLAYSQQSEDDMLNSECTFVSLEAVHGSWGEMQELQVKLCAKQYISQLCIFAVKVIIKSHTAKLQRQHWLNTRAVVARMNRAEVRSERSDTRCRSLPSRQ